ncbi:MAG: hypothetical protein HXX08_11535 [Chloroflexi bacterium]|uniref:Uncharacterized protein n=1 Tax=Candidatus Chlorohelix allophototropha TaxID=3003348 RepID=A0A8T7M0X7_9CHLR|nr:hypothetical protein [Chloroflexota bacterium]WJW65870.1 hypothetical protein OZ401_001649 [Chloroflexota bacterium L227-S17]
MIDITANNYGKTEPKFVFAKYEGKRVIRCQRCKEHIQPASQYAFVSFHNNRSVGWHPDCANEEVDERKNQNRLIQQETLRTLGFSNEELWTLDHILLPPISGTDRAMQNFSLKSFLQVGYTARYHLENISPEAQAYFMQERAALLNRVKIELARLEKELVEAERITEWQSLK